MRFAEVFLRLGSALVAWMLLYAYFLWLAALYVIGCGPDGAEMHQLLLGMAPFICGAVFLIQVTHPLTEIQSILRWLGLPLILLLPFAGRSVWQVFQSVNINDVALCASPELTTWQSIWAPAHVATLMIVTLVIVRVWLATRSVLREEMERQN